MADLACQDDEIIEFHYNNKTVIEGRYGVHFSSAFQVKVPILKEKIVEIIFYDYKYIDPKYRLN